MKKQQRAGIAVLCAAAAAMTLTSCGAKGDSSTAQAAELPRNPMEIEVDEKLMQRVQLGEATWAQVGATLTVAARVEVDETRVTRVGSPVMGRIGSLSVHEGQQVRTGQVLAQVNSVGMSDAQLSFLKALSSKQVATRAVERAQLLLKADVIGVAELQRREAELAQATAELAASRDELELLGMPDESINNLEKTRTLHSVSRIVASSDGTVLERHITIGQVVQPADTVFEVADLSQVWLVADVPEQIAGNIVEGMEVEAQVAALPGQTFRGKLSRVSAIVNPETRTVRARMELANANRRLKPAMLATMMLKNQTERRQVVPITAVVRDEGAEYLFVRLDDKTFTLRPVTLGQEYGGRRVVLDGLREGDRIVVDGAFHLNNERRRRSVRGSDGD